LPEYKKVPIIAVTGFAAYDDRERSLAAGFNAHMKKPIEPSELIGLVKALSG